MYVVDSGMARESRYEHGNGIASGVLALHYVLALVEEECAITSLSLLECAQGWQDKSKFC